MATTFYGEGVKHFFSGGLDWDTTTSLKCALLLSTYTENDNTHTTRSHVSTYEATGQTYQAIPATLSVSKNTADNKVYLMCGQSCSFSGVTASQAIGSLVVFHDTGTTAGELISKLEFSGGTFTSNGQVITVTFGSGAGGYAIGSITY